MISFGITYRCQGKCCQLNDFLCVLNTCLPQFAFLDFYQTSVMALFTLSYQYSYMWLQQSLFLCQRNVPCCQNVERVAFDWQHIYPKVQLRALHKLLQQLLYLKVLSKIMQAVVRLPRWHCPRDQKVKFCKIFLSSAF